MTMSELRVALDAATAARAGYLARCLMVWRELQAVEPALTADILDLGFDDAGAARWVCEPHLRGESPAAWVIAGRVADLQAEVDRAMAGFVG